MQLINTPGKLTLPFASAGGKNSIPVASQIGITPGAASLTDGFPPLTRTPLAAGGSPPDGLDMNGILYELSAVVRWANAGGGYAYDSAFATDPNVSGYPKGARVMRSDGLGYWLNTTENNQVDPETSGAVAAGWVPDFTSGATSVTMTSANVTLTPLQYGKPIIIITGTLTANLNLIFPDIAGKWIVVNSTSGAFTITAKTSAGTGVTLTQSSVSWIYGDGINIGGNNYLQLSGGTLTGALNEAHGANIASASTLNLDSATGNFLHVTGTTTITAITLTAGRRTVVFNGALTLTNGASLILPGGANITTAAGDIATFISEGGGTVRCTGYQRAALNSSIVHIVSNTTLDATYNNKTVMIDAACTVTLPTIAASVDGMEIVFVQGAADGTAISISRGGTDQIIMNAALINALPFARFGDFIKLKADNVNGRWAVIADGIMGPSFEAATTTTTALTNGTPTKLAFNSEVSDPYACYDNATNYRFTPLIPGWYTVTLSAYVTSTASNRVLCHVYKNGSAYQAGSRALSSQSGSYDTVTTVCTDVYLNGTTDYVEAYATISDQNGTFTNTIPSSFKAVRSR